MKAPSREEAVTSGSQSGGVAPSISEIIVRANSTHTKNAFHQACAVPYGIAVRISSQAVRKNNCPENFKDVLLE